MTGAGVPTHVESKSALPHTVFVGIDGTLCDSRRRAPGPALGALTQARDRGHLPFTCTGRSTPKIYTRFQDIGFEGLIGGAGRYASVGGRVLVDERIPHEHVGMLITL